MDSGGGIDGVRNVVEFSTENPKIVNLVSAEIPRPGEVWLKVSRGGEFFRIRLGLNATGHLLDKLYYAYRHWPR